MLIRPVSNSLLSNKFDPAPFSAIGIINFQALSRSHLPGKCGCGHGLLLPAGYPIPPTFQYIGLTQYAKKYPQIWVFGGPTPAKHPNLRSLSVLLRESYISLSGTIRDLQGGFKLAYIQDRALKQYIQGLQQTRCCPLLVQTLLVGCT